MGLSRIFKDPPTAEPLKKRSQKLSVSELTLWGDNLLSGIGQSLHSNDDQALEEAEEQAVALLVVIQTLRSR